MLQPTLDKDDTNKQLMGGIQGMFLAQYEVLRKNGHSPSEAFNETVEEATQSLFPLIGKYGMDYMYNACSTTARRGALDWAPKFKEYVYLTCLLGQRADSQG
jgi:ketol-acid reductoisomerase